MTHAAPTTTHALAERHEALWLSLNSLHKDTLALGAKKPEAAVSEPVRVTAEGLLSDCAPYIRRRGEKLPVAAPDLAGLAVQLGQALAGLDAYQSLHTFIDARWDCLMWRVGGPALPVLRLQPPVAALKAERTDMADLRRRLAKRIDERRNGVYQEGFAAGLAARHGPPAAASDPAAPAAQVAAAPAQTQNNPRILRLD